MSAKLGARALRKTERARAMTIQGCARLNSRPELARRVKWSRHLSTPSLKKTQKTRKITRMRAKIVIDLQLHAAPGFGQPWRVSSARVCLLFRRVS